MTPRRPARMRAQSGSVAQARAMLLQGDEAPTVNMGGAEAQLLQGLVELGEQAVGLASAYLYSVDPATADEELADFAEKVAVKVSGEIARMQLWLQVPLNSAPDAD